MSVAIPGNTITQRQKTTREMGAVASTWARWVEAVGQHSIRYGLVLVLLLIGAMKFTTYEAEAISGFVANSPLMSWAYQVLGLRQLSALLGVMELLIAVFIAVRPISARLSAIGGILAMGMFLTTLSFLFSTPGTIVPSLGFPALSGLPGQFLIKDIVLLGGAIWTTGEAFRAIQRNSISSNANGK